MTIIININANMNPAGFAKFENYYFVETGTYRGNGIRLALRATFQELHSIEANEQIASEAQIIFRPYPNVHIWHGDSGKMLFNIIEKMDKPITFWLDAHTGSNMPGPGKNTPILDELEQIKKHPIKTHTIIIDDMHCCGTILFDFITKQEIIDRIKEINPDYKIIYINGGDQQEAINNIMIATVH